MPYQQKSGLGTSAAYQVSGAPFASGSLSAVQGAALKVEFPSVTRWIAVINKDTNDLKCGFSENGLAGSNFFTVTNSTAETTSFTSPRLELKVTEVWFTGSADFDIVAGLTGIATKEVPNNWSGSSGVG